MRSLALIAVSFALAACGDIEVRSVRAPGAVPRALLGEWSGTWQATASGNTGNLLVRVQEFEGAPVVNVEIENPCIEPRTYELVVTAATIELRADGRTVIAAVLGDQGQTLIGTYECTAETGTWSATWQRSLPEITDLSGNWAGTLVVGGQPERAMALELQQRVEGGVVLLDAMLELGDVWLPLPMRGSAVFRMDGFDVILSTLSGNQPVLLLTGMGEHAPLRIEHGILQALGSQPPFQSGVFTITQN